MVNCNQDLEEALAAALSELSAAKSRINYLEAAVTRSADPEDREATMPPASGHRFLLADLVESQALMGDWQFDLDTACITWSPEVARLHDQPEGISLKRDAAFDCYIPQHRERIQTALTACAEKGRCFDEVLRTKAAKGRYLWLRATGEPVRNDAGQIISVQGLFQDVSDLLEMRDEE